MYKLKIKEYRIAAGYTQKDLATLLNISKSYYSEIESAKYPVKLSTLCEIGQALQVEANKLFIHALEKE